MFSVLFTNFNVSEIKISKTKHKHRIFKQKDYFSCTLNNFLHFFKLITLKVLHSNKILSMFTTKQIYMHVHVWHEWEKALSKPSRTLCYCWYDKETKCLNKIKTSKAQLPWTALSNTESFKLAILGNHSNTDCSLKNNPLKGKPTGPDPAPLPNSFLLPPTLISNSFWFLLPT